MLRRTSTALACIIYVLFFLAPISPAETLTLATTTDQFARLGREAAETTIQQSFVIPDAKIASITFALARRGDPTVPIKIALRETREGPDLASTTVQPANVSDDLGNPTTLTALFDSVQIAAGERFLALSAPLADGSGTNHYYVALGRWLGEGTFYYKNNPHSRDLVGSIEYLTTDPPAPPPPSDDPAPDPPPAQFEGFGSHTEGGSNETFRVTSLADSGSGTLRDALSRGHRLIVFDVAGEIYLEKSIEIREPFITIDGFSAPSPGITIVGGVNALTMHGPSSPYVPNSDAHDIIIRGVRLRDVHGDAIQISWGAHNIVVDHVSTAGSSDGNIDITHGAHDVTVSWSILGMSNKNQLVKRMVDEAASGQTHPFGNISLHHNIYEGAGARNPRVSNGLVNTGAEAEIITADVRNNVIVNWKSGIGSDAECGAKVNFVNNYYYNTRKKDVALIIRGPGDYAGCTTSAGDPIGAFAHVAGNISGNGVKINDGKWIKHNQPDPFPFAPVKTSDTCTAAREVLESAGVFPRDPVDEAIVESVVLAGKCSSK